MSLLFLLLVPVLLSGVSALISVGVARAYPARGQFVSVPGGRLHFVDQAPLEKARATIVLIHGASSNQADLLAALGPGLNHNYRVIAIDRPGQGWSERLGGREMAQPDAQSRAIAAALDTIGTGPVIIVAHSLAGAMASHMALERPDLVRGLVLLAGVTHPWPGGIAWHYGPASTPVLGSLFTWGFAVPLASLVIDSAAREVFSPSVPPSDYIEAGQIRLVLRPASFLANAQDVSVLKDFVASQAPRYASLGMPVVAITGDTDTVVSPTIHSATMARAVKNGKLVVVEGAGHMPHHKGRARVLAEIDRLAGDLHQQDRSSTPLPHAPS
jgi:pimeloyl-ACP methyl ester carboxylesterase